MSFSRDFCAGNWKFSTTQTMYVGSLRTTEYSVSPTHLRPIVTLNVCHFPLGTDPFGEFSILERLPLSYHVEPHEIRVDKIARVEIVPNDLDGLPMVTESHRLFGVVIEHSHSKVESDAKPEHEDYDRSQNYESHFVHHLPLLLPFVPRLILRDRLAIRRLAFFVAAIAFSFPEYENFSSNHVAQRLEESSGNLEQRVVIA